MCVELFSSNVRGQVEPKSELRGQQRLTLSSCVFSKDDSDSELKTCLIVGYMKLIQTSFDAEIVRQHF